MENPASSQLSYENHASNDQVLTSEGDLFEKCIITWSQLTLFLLEALHDEVYKVERHTILTIRAKMISEMVEVMGNIESVGVRMV